MTRVLTTAAMVLGLLFATSGRADAHPWATRDIGFGIVLGQPTGLTVDIRPNHWSSFEIDLGLGTFDNDDSTYAHLTYQVRLFDLTHKRKMAVPLYLGIGVYIADGRGHDFDDDAHVGVRAPIGIAFEFRPPVQIFIELALLFNVIHIGHDFDHDNSDFDGALGFRFYF